MTNAARNADRNRIACEAADIARTTARRAPASLFGMCPECGARIDDGLRHESDCPDAIADTQRAPAVSK